MVPGRADQINSTKVSFCLYAVSVFPLRFVFHVARGSCGLYPRRVSSDTDVLLVKNEVKLLTKPVRNLLHSCYNEIR